MIVVRLVVLVPVKSCDYTIKIARFSGTVLVLPEIDLVRERRIKNRIQWSSVAVVCCCFSSCGIYLRLERNISIKGLLVIFLEFLSFDSLIVNGHLEQKKTGRGEFAHFEEEIMIARREGNHVLDIVLVGLGV